MWNLNSKRKFPRTVASWSKRDLQKHHDTKVDTN